MLGPLPHGATDRWRTLVTVPRPDGAAMARELAAMRARASARKDPDPVVGARRPPRPHHLSLPTAPAPARSVRCRGRSAGLLAGTERRSMMAALARVRRTEIDGVPVFWVDSGRRTLTAHLQFRTGSADETLPTSGLTHLAQHLALGSLSPRVDREVGGRTGLLRTTFHVHGEVPGVRRFLVDVCEWLDGPDLSRVQSEGSVLRRELDAEDRSPGALALLRRYGARGPGLVGFGKPALHGASPDAVRHLLHAWFTRGNAACVLDGPPPKGFRLPLRDGPRRPVPEPPATGDPRPAAYVADDTMSVSGEVARTPAASVLPELLQRAIRRDLVDLRDQPWATYESVGLVSAVVAAGFRVAPPLLDQVVEYTHGAVEALCRNGPRGEDVDRGRRCGGPAAR